MAEFMARFTTILQPAHDQGNHQRQRVKPAVNRVGHTMLGENRPAPFRRRYHLNLGHFLLAALAKTYFKPSGFLAFHHKFIPLR